MNTKWEYKWVEIIWDTNSQRSGKVENPDKRAGAFQGNWALYSEQTDSAAILNHFGLEGWEAVSTHNDLKKQWVLLKRMIPEDSPN